MPAIAGDCGAHARELGGVDILVNNAAHQATFSDISEISDEEWELTFRVNIHAMFYLTKAAVAHMKPGSAIINTTSINADSPSPKLLAYATTPRAPSRTSRQDWRRCWPKRAFAPMRCTRPDLDAAHSLHNAGGFGEEFRQAGPHAAPRSAGGNWRPPMSCWPIHCPATHPAPTIAVTGGKPII